MIDYIDGNAILKIEVNVEFGNAGMNHDLPQSRKSVVKDDVRGQTLSP